MLVLLLPSSSQAGLQWGKPAVTAPATQATNPLRSNVAVRDEAVTPAVWGAEEVSAPTASQAQFDPFEEDFDAEFVELTPTPQTDFDSPTQEAEDLLPTVDNLVDENRVAQLVNDPFEEPLEGPVPPLDEDLEEVSEAIRREQELRNKEREQSAQQRSDEREQGIDIEGLVPPSQAEPIRPFPYISPGSEMEQNRKNCETELEAAKADRISNVDLNIRIDGTAGEDYPFTCSLGNEPLMPRSWSMITYNWKASALCHKPLYFEQDQLERYGHDWGPALQPILSGVHFFTSAAILPYKMGIESPNECIYALGHYRPGGCAPYIIEATPFTWRAAFYQAGVITGMSFVIP